MFHYKMFCLTVKTLGLCLRKEADKFEIVLNLLPQCKNKVDSPLYLRNDEAYFWSLTDQQHNSLHFPSGLN